MPSKKKDKVLPVISSREFARLKYILDKFIQEREGRDRSVIISALPYDGKSIHVLTNFDRITEVFKKDIERLNSLFACQYSETGIKEEFKTTRLENAHEDNL